MFSSPRRLPFLPSGTSSRRRYRLRGRAISRAVLLVCALALVALFLPAQAEAQYSQTLPWNYAAGNPSSFSAYLNGQVTLSGDQNGTGVTAQTSAGGSIAGHSKEIFSASAVLSADLAVPSGTVTAKVFGNSVYSKHLGSPFTGNLFADNPRYSYDSCQTLDQSLCAIQEFTVGPFLILVEEGVKGSVALNYSVGLSKGVVSASLTPAVSGSVYITAEVEFFLADVGVGANLTLINDSLPIGVTATLAPSFFASPPGWGVKWGFNLTNKLTLLSGNLFLYVDLNLPFFDHSWQTTIFSWPGTSINTTLFNDTGFVPIGVPLPYLSSLSPSSVTAGSGNLQLTIGGSGFDAVDPFSVAWDGSPIAVQNLTATQVVVNIPTSKLVSAGQHEITVTNGGTLGGTSNPLPFHVVLGAPVLTQISPGAVTAGGSDFTLTVYGSSLIPGSTVLWNSSALPTTHISDSQLTAIVPAQDISSVGTAQISVTYPGTSSPTSNILILLISDPNHPIITGTMPSGALPGSVGLTMHVVGTGFVNGAVVYWSGSPLPTTYISGVQLDVQVPASLMAVQTVAQIDVLNAGGLPSNSVAFTIAPLTYTAVPIPLPPGQTGNWAAVDVNVNGLVAVNPLDTVLAFAYLWTEAGGIVTLPTPVGAPFPNCVPVLSSISRLNNLGQVVGTVGMAGAVGGTFAPGNGCPGGSPSFLYTNGALTYPFPLGFGATGINDHGAVAGSGDSTTAWVTVWQAGTIQHLAGPGTPFGGGPASINNANQVIGNFDQFSPNELAYTAFLWNGGGSPTALPSQYSDPLWGQQATGINDFGTVVGYGSTGWMWQNGTISPLPIFPEGFVPIGPNELAAAQKRTINNNGDIIGTGGNYSPILYSHGQSHNLNDLLSNPDVGSVGSVLSIADNGLIAGTLRHADGTIGPVLLKPSFVQSSLNTLSLSSAAQSVPHGFWNGSQLVTAPVTGVQPTSVTVGTGNFQVTVNGTSFVSGAIVFWNGKPLSTTFSSSTSLIAAVPAPLIASTGYATITAANPGGDVSNGFVIAIVNPTPTLSTLSPVQAVAGGAGFTLTISGANFQPGSQIYWNQVLLSGTYFSSNQLTAVVPTSLLASPSIEAITVVNSTPGGGASTPIIFGVNPPAPVANTLSPSSAIAGSGNLTLTISGGGFDATSVVLWNSVALQTTYVSPSVLSVQIPASDLATAGSGAVTVTDTIPGGWPSKSLIFTVNNPTPQVNSVSPSSVQAGGGGSTITASGTSFVSDSQVYLDGSPLATTYVSSSQLTANLSNSDVAIAKTAQLTVINPQPCNTPLSGPIAFTITAPPLIQTVNPGIARAGSAALAIQITGSGFTSQSVVTWSGTPLPTSFVSATRVNATVPSQSIASPGTFPIRVMQQVLGGGSSAAVAFTVYATTLPLPAITVLAPSGVRAGSNNFVLALSGSGIVSTTSALWNGIALPSAVVSPNMVLVQVPDANISSPGKVTIQLQNPTDTTGSGGGLSNPVVFSVFDSSQAVTTDYTSASAFSAAVPNITTIGFNGILVAGQSSASFNPLGLYGLTLSTPTPRASVTVLTSGFYAPNNYPGDFITASGSSNSGNTLVISLPQPIYALGLNYGALNSASSTITLSNGHVFSPTTTPGVGKTAFAGFVSTDPITSLTLVTTNDWWVVLNLLVGSVKTQLTPVPSGEISVTASGLAYSRVNQTFNGTVTIQNVSSSMINGPFEVVFTALPKDVSVVNSTGTDNGLPYLTVPFATGLGPGQAVTVNVQFKNPNNVSINFTPIIYSGSF